jgi:diguanylate cyclase (GGDEF)-like protein/PAS domain S-box-containing protein
MKDTPIFDQNDSEALATLLSLALDAGEIGVWDWNIESNITIWDDRMFEIYGLDKIVPMLYENWINTVLQEDRPNAAASAQRAISNKTKHTTQFRIIKADHSVRQIQSTVDVVCDDSGNVLGLVGLDVDITEKKLTSDALILSNSRNEIAEKMGHVGSWEQIFDSEELFWSNEVYNIFEFDSKSPMTFEQFIDRVHPDERSLVSLAFEKSVEEHNKYYIEHRLLFPDGRIKHVIERAEHFYDENNKHIKTVGTVQDYTEKKTLEQEAEKSYQMLFKLTENVPGAIYQYRLYPDGRATFPHISNGIKELYEISPDDLLHDATPAFDRIHQNDLAIVVSSIEESAATMKDWVIEYRVKLPKKGVRWIEGHAKPEELKDGSILWHGYIHDITEEKIKEEALIQSNKRFEHAEHAGNVGSWEYDINTRNYWASTQAKTIFGMPKDENSLTEELILSCIVEQERVYQALVDLLEKNTEYNLEYEINPFDGSSSKIISSIATVVLDDAKNPLKVTGFIQDITEKQENLKKLQQKKQQLERMMTNAPNPMILHEEGGKILMLNQAWIDASGFSLKDTPTIDDWVEHTHDDAEAIIAFKKHINSLYDITEKVDEGEFSFLNKYKDLLTWQVYSSPLGIIDGKRTIITSAMDITERSKLQKELEIEKNRFALAVDGSRDGLWDWNLQTDEFFFGDRFEVMLGYTPGTLGHNTNTWVNLVHPDDIEPLYKVVQEYFDTKGKGSYENTFRLLTKDGSWKWILGRGKAEFAEDGTPLRFVGFNTDITEQIEYQDKINHSAKHDLLTNLPNRFLLSELLTHEMKMTKRGNKQLALLFIDLDGFKEVNDVFGHDAGDEVLSVVASRMNNVVRESDIVSRLGGDEFVIVITVLNKSEELIPLLHRLLKDLSSTIKHNEHNIQISASIGVSLYPQNMDIGNEALLRQADQAMYIAKTSGKNQYKFFNIEASDELIQNKKDISNLRNAMTENQFELYYQPKVNMKTNTVVGFEALLRWNHPEKGLLFPNDFLPLVAQDASLMIELGNWVFEKAFLALESWHLKGLDITLSINASSHEVQQEGFSLYLKTLLDKHQGIKPNTVEIELLETAAFDNFELTSKILEECQELGVSIAIDDFGTGYASLHYLKKLPMNTLKIDKSFVIDLLHTSSSLSIIEASVGLARAFNVNLVAEGVESEEQGKILLQIGCIIAQGYVVAKAMPAENVIKWIASYKGFSSWAKIVPLNDDQRAILYASVEHRSWIYSFESFIKNTSNNPPQLDAASCYLGQWIINCSSDEYLSHPEFEQLQTFHTKLHSYADKLILSNKNEKLAGIEKLKSLCDEILKRLESLMNSNCR